MRASAKAAMKATVKGRGNGKTRTNGRGQKAESERVEIEPIKSAFVKVEIIGDSDLHVHAMSTKTERQIEEGAQRKEEAKLDKNRRRTRPPKDPWADFCNALHILPGKRLPWRQTVSKVIDGVPQLPFPIGTVFRPMNKVFGFPAAGIGQGIRNILKDYGYKPMDRAGIWVHSEFGKLMPISYSELIFERVPCRVGPYKVADMHYRGLFRGWSTHIVIEYDTDRISLKQLINAVNRAGRYCGLGEERKSSPKNPGDEGMYHVRPLRQ